MKAAPPVPVRRPLFFESAAVGNISIEGGNPTRVETNAEAVRLDTRLRTLWSQHPRFVVVPHHPSFMKKIMLGLAMLERLVALSPRTGDKTSA